VTGPLLSDQALAGLRERIESGLEHTAVLDLETKTVPASGDEFSEWTLGTEEIPCRMQVVGTRIAELAAAQGVQAQWAVGFELGTPIYPGRHRALIRGERDERGVPRFVRLVNLTGDLGLLARLHRITTAVDASLDQ